MLFVLLLPILPLVVVNPPPLLMGRDIDPVPLGSISNENDLELVEQALTRWQGP